MSSKHGYLPACYKILCSCPASDVAITGNRQIVHKQSTTESSKVYSSSSGSVASENSNECPAWIGKQLRLGRTQVHRYIQSKCPLFQHC